MESAVLLQELQKALEAGQYTGAPGTLVQGSALMSEDLSPVMHLVTYGNEEIKLQKMVKSSGTKSVLWQFNRQLSYGQFGGSANFEGQVGQEETSDYVRDTVAMAFYSHIRRVTVVANLVATADGKKAEDRAASDAAMKIAADVEFDLFRGKADFSNAGVFDGNPLAIAALPNMVGLDVQIRKSDYQSNTQDLMFSEFGSDLSVVIAGGATLSQPMVEDAQVRSQMNMGHANKLLVDPLVLSAYNKIVFSKDRVNYPGAVVSATGADLSGQNTTGGLIKIEASRFLSGKFKPQRARSTSPGAPTIALAQAASSTTFTSGQAYVYYVTSVNELGESPASASSTATIAANGNLVNVTITPPGSGTVRYFNVYRSGAGGSTSTARFIGRVANSGAATTVFKDLGNKLPGFVTGFLVQGDTMEIKELAPYSRLKLAISDLSIPEAHYRFCCLAVMEPRKNVLIDNLIGSF